MHPFDGALGSGLITRISAPADLFRSPRAFRHPSHPALRLFRSKEFMDAESVCLREPFEGGKSKILFPPGFDRLVILVRQTRSLGESLLCQAVLPSKMP